MIRSYDMVHGHVISPNLYLGAMIIIVFICIIPGIFALPVTNGDNTNSDSICLAVVLTLFCLLSLLVALKRLYIKRRRLVVQNPSLEALTQSSSSSFLPSFQSSISQNAVKSAFLVGFFGSPAWESKLAVSEKFSWKERSYTALSDGRRSFNSRPSTSNETAYLSEFGAKRNFPTHDINSNPHFKSYPVMKKKSHTIERHRSLPVSTRKLSGEFAHRKRHSSLKSTTSRRSDILYPGLRIINSESYAEPALPLSPDLSLPPPSVPPDFNSVPNEKAPLSLPMVSPLLSPLLSDSSDGRSFISHPYALLPKRKQTVKSSTPQFLPLAEAQAFEAAVEYVNCYPPTDSHPASETTSFQSHSILRSPQQAATLPRTRHRGRKPSIRPRKASLAGPSPLRIMTLPESLTSELGSNSDTNDTNDNPTPTSLAPQRNPSKYSNLGLGFPSTYQPSRRLSKIEEDDSGLILGIIRELVEETNNWDASLYMDENFKAMIDGSSRNSTTLSPSPSTVAIKAFPSQVELDLGLLDLEVIKMTRPSSDHDFDDKNPTSYEQDGYTFPQKP